VKSSVKSSPFSAHVTKLLEECCKPYQASILEIILRGTEQRRIVEMYVDSPKGITLELCSELSHAMDAVFEAEQVFTGAYRLDVSSPGVDRPLEYYWQYQRNVGRLVAIELWNETKVLGRIAHATEDALTLEPAKKLSKSAQKKQADNTNVLALPATVLLADIRQAVVQIDLRQIEK
jgi:ribosome maturation factor RimP